MKEIVEHYREKEILFRSLKPVALKELGSRKKVDIYLGVDIQKYYVMILRIEKKSRILRKEIEEFVLLHQRLEKWADSKIVKKYIMIKAPLCSKAKVSLEEHAWEVEVLV